jgi:hypothetical protein
VIVIEQKTTTLRSVAGLERPEGGEITIGDTETRICGRAGGRRAPSVNAGQPVLRRREGAAPAARITLEKAQLRGTSVRSSIAKLIRFLEGEGNP